MRRECREMDVMEVAEAPDGTFLHFTDLAVRVSEPPSDSKF